MQSLLRNQKNYRTYRTWTEARNETTDHCLSPLCRKVDIDTLILTPPGPRGPRIPSGHQYSWFRAGHCWLNNQLLVMKGTHKNLKNLTGDRNPKIHNVDSGGSKGAPSANPNVAQNFRNFMQFFENFRQNHRLAPPPRGFLPPPTGNPGSAPGRSTTVISPRLRTLAQ